MHLAMVREDFDTGDTELAIFSDSKPVMCAIALIYIYTLAHFWYALFKIPVSLLYEPTENELQGSEMAISKNKAGSSR